MIFETREEAWKRCKELEMKSRAGPMFFQPFELFGKHGVKASISLKKFISFAKIFQNIREISLDLGFEHQAHRSREFNREAAEFIRLCKWAHRNSIKEGFFLTEMFYNEPIGDKVHSEISKLQRQIKIQNRFVDLMRKAMK